MFFRGAADENPMCFFATGETNTPSVYNKKYRVICFFEIFGTERIDRKKTFGEVSSQVFFDFFFRGGSKFFLSLKKHVEIFEIFGSKISLLKKVF